jgi:hypothetical protein
MGPIILADKSAVEALASRELNFLRRFYTLNVAPVLVLEILADLKKDAPGGSSKRWVIILARKIANASAVNVHHGRMLESCFGGHDILMRGVPIVHSDRTTIGPDGKYGIIIEESPEEQALLRWRHGQFSQAEEILADRWRVVTRAADLEGLQRLLKRVHSRLPDFGSVSALRDFVDRFISQTDATTLLEWFLREMPFRLMTRIRGFAHFVISKAGSIQRFSSYLHYCLVVTLMFRFGLARGLITPRATNWIDLEYLYYLPFCNIFVSRDQMHVDLVSPLLTNEQRFIHGDELKRGLGRMANWWEGMSESDRGDFDASAGVGPPEWQDSPTFQAWQEFMDPNYRRRGPRNLMDTLEPQVLDRVMRHIRRHLDESTTSPVSVNTDDPGVTFVAKKKTVCYDDPCFCGSEKIFGDCHGKGLKFQV